MDYAGDQFLAALVFGVCLAREDELYGAIGAIHDRGESCGVSEYQIAAFVGGEAAGETDRQCVRVEDFFR